MSNFYSRTRRGCRAPNAALSPAQVKEARALEQQGYTAAQIKARLELTCSEETVRRVVRGETYREEAG